MGASTAAIGRQLADAGVVARSVDLPRGRVVERPGARAPGRRIPLRGRGHAARGRDADRRGAGVRPRR